MLILHPPVDAVALLERKVLAYQQATERLLGAAPGAFQLLASAPKSDGNG